MPPGLQPDRAANGHCNAPFYDWQFSRSNEEYLDPARYQYREFLKVPHSVKIGQAWVGEGFLTLPFCRGEEMSDLTPVRAGMGMRASMAYVVDDLKTLKDLRE